MVRLVWFVSRVAVWAMSYLLCILGRSVDWVIGDWFCLMQLVFGVGGICHGAGLGLYDVSIPA